MNALSQAKHELSRGNFSRVIDLLEPKDSEQAISVETAHYLGIAFAQLNNFSSAKKYLEFALHLQPNNINIINNFAICYEQEGDIENALKLYQQGLMQDANNVDILNNIGDLLRKQNRHDEAKPFLEKAVRVNPNHFASLTNLAIVLQQQHDYKAAEEFFRSVISLQPKYAPGYANLGSLLHKIGRYADSVEAFYHALEINPHYTNALISIASPLINLGRLQEAKSLLQKARALEPNNVMLLTNMGRLHHEEGEIELAIIHYNRALQLNPHLEETRWHRAFSYLLLGDYGKGWDDYEAGIPLGERQTRDFHIPVWRGEPLTGKTITVCAEQGLGDEIMFSSCISDLTASAKHVRLECDKRLTQLFRNAFPTISTIERHSSKHTNSPSATSDYQVAIGSLPRFFRRHLDNFPARHHYFVADELLVREWMDRYAKLGDCLKIGISWRGGTTIETGNRTIPLQQWLPILSTSGCQFVDLQYGDTNDERTQFEQKNGIVVHRFPETDPLVDQNHFAAQIAALDLIISVSNSTVHLSGALGKATWSLLPYVPSWRWRIKGDTTPWYQNVRLFRQPSTGEWSSVINTIAKRLCDFKNRENR